MNINRCAVLLALSALGHTAVAQQSTAALPSRNYDLLVVTANGNGFRDCMSFTEDHGLVLQAARDVVIDYLMESTDPAGRRFHAVSNGSGSASNPYGLAIHGSFVGPDGIRGDAINDRGLTFTFSGRSNQPCTIASAIGTPYAAAPAHPVLFEPARGSLAGETYGVDLYGDAENDDCFIFAINGTLERSAGADLRWGMDDRNASLGTFQAVGTDASAGIALRGEVAAWGELRVHGIASTSSSTGLREIVGSGRPASACIAD